MDMNTLNVSATLNIFRLFAKPSLCLPQATISTFNHLPIPLNAAFDKRYGKVDIRAVVLDKDNCFARPGSNEVYGPYEDHFKRLKDAYPGRKLLIVSNSSGTSSLDPNLTQAAALTKATNISVLPHSTKKPGCGPEIMEYFLQHPETGVTKPEHVAIVGDRLTTDVMMANFMGSYGVWVKDGILKKEENGFLVRMEQKFAVFLLRRGCEAPIPPPSQFEG